MANINASDLIAKFQHALDNQWGYVLGTSCTKWTQALQNQKVQYMIDRYGSNWKTAGKGDGQYYNALYCGKWVGHYVTDCSGLFAWAFKSLGGYMYHGSNTMWNKYCVHQGKLSNGRRTDGQELKPGTAVFVLKGSSDRSHVGLYIGNGTVIEASGQSTGVITSQITNKKWAEWGEMKGVNYNAQEGVPVDNSDKTTGSAVVNATKVALREFPSTKASVLTRVDINERVQILEPDSAWLRVTYQGKTGYMMTKFLNR